MSNERQLREALTQKGMAIAVANGWIPKSLPHDQYLSAWALMGDFVDALSQPPAPEQAMPEAAPEGWMRDEKEVQALLNHLINCGWVQTDSGPECIDQGAAMAAEVVERVLLPLLSASPAAPDGCCEGKVSALCPGCPRAAASPAAPEVAKPDPFRITVDEMVEHDRRIGEAVDAMMAGIETKPQHPQPQAPEVAKPDEGCVVHGFAHPCVACANAWPGDPSTQDYASTQPQSQGELEVVAIADGTFNCGAVLGSELITLQSHREAIAKRDAALVACVEALEVVKQSDYGRNWVWPETARKTATENVSAAITQANGVLGRKEGGV